MKLDGTLIDDTFAEAFRMRYSRVLVTATDAHWVGIAVTEFTGYGTSIIACDAEAGRETLLDGEKTPDGRPGAATLLFGFSTDAVGKAVANRAGQCLMTCATTAVYDGLPAAPDRFPLGKHLRFFGDGFQKSKVVDGRRYWRVPVMDGEFLVEDTAGVAKGVAGGNIILQGETPEVAVARRSGKMRLDSIRKKAKEIRETTFPSETRVVEIDADRPLDEVLLLVRGAIWGSII